MNSFFVYVEPIYDPKQKTYSKILTLSQMPSSPLSAYVISLKSPFLSTLDNPYSNKYRCVYALAKALSSALVNGIRCCDYRSGSEYMTPDDISDLVSYLTQNNYTIDTYLTTVLQNSNVVISGSSGMRSSGGSGSSNKTILFAVKSG